MTQIVLFASLIGVDQVIGGNQISLWIKQSGVDDELTIKSI